MRNLKRVLSLALATVMLMGMMVMGASAADKKPLTDLEKVTNKDAVNLMVDLEVITGKPDGSYAPAETVDRATMSTLIYKIMTGETNADSYKGTGVLKDVPGNWAEGFINYCNSLKIVTGDGTNFYPGNKVTVAQAAKMLLTAVGYDAELSKYQGDAMWTVNVMRDAKKAGILAGVGQNSNDELTRDNAAQMVFNTLFADIVKPVIDRDQGVAYLTRYDKVGSTLASETYSIVEVTGTVADVKDGKASFTAVSPSHATILKAINDAEIIAGSDMKGKNATMYIKGNVSYNATTGAVTGATVDKVYSTTLSSGATNVLGTSMDGTSYTDTLTKKTAKGFIAEENATAVTYYVNGSDIKTGTTKYAKTDIDTLSKKPGVIVELIDTEGKGTVDLVKVTSKEAKKVTGDVLTRTYKDEPQVSIPGVIGYTDTVKVTGYENLAKDDYVLVYTDADKNVYIELAETITGKITGKKATGEIRVNGTYYGWSKLDNSNDIDDVMTAAPDSKLDTTNEYLFVLDNNGTITKRENITKENTSKTAIVLDSAYVTGGGIGASKYLEVQLLLADGTTEVVTVEKVGDKTGAALSGDNVVTKNAFYDYTVDGDKYTLKETAGVTNLGSAFKVENGKTPVTTSFTANAKTVYLVQKGTGDKAEYSVYTGYANVPTMNIAASSASKVVADGKIAKYVFLTTDKFVGDSETLNYVYLIDPANYDFVAKDGDVAAHYNYPAIIDGVKDIISVDAELAKTVTAGLYNLELVDGIADDAAFSVTANKIDLSTFDLTEDSTDSIKDGVAIVAAINSGKAHTYDADTTVYVIEVTMKEGKVSDADVMNETTGTDYKFTPEDGYTYQVVVAPAKDGGEALSALYIFQTLVSAP